MMMRKKNNRDDYLLLILIVIVFAFGSITLIKKQNTISKNEGRQLATFSHFSLDEFLDGSFQSNMEQALADQFIGSDEIKTGYSYLSSHLIPFDYKSLLCQNKYLKLSSRDRNRAILGCDDYILYMPEQLDDEKKTIVLENMAKYNHVNEMVDAYYYFVDDASSFDFMSVDKRKNDYLKEAISQLDNAKGIGRLEYDTTAEYMNYFYKTDHHWNLKGSYQGIIDISKMMRIETPDDKHIQTNGDQFYGSNARMTNNYDYSEVFEYYDYALKPHLTFINGRKKDYNHYKEYKEHDYDYYKAMNLYAFVYGDDYGEVIFDYNQPKKENLLIISDSFGNAINEVIAQSFNKTFAVDLRYYQSTFGEEFRLSDYIKENDISKVLFIMSPISIWSREANQGLES